MTCFLIGCILTTFAYAAAVVLGAQRGIQFLRENPDVVRWVLRNPEAAPAEPEKPKPEPKKVRSTLV